MNERRFSLEHEAQLLKGQILSLLKKLWLGTEIGFVIHSIILFNPTDTNSCGYGRHALQERWANQTRERVPTLESVERDF